MKWLADRIAGFAQAALLVFALLGLLQCAGCASGVQMSDEERIACRNEGCVVYTRREQEALIGAVAREGYKLGWMDAIRQTAKDL